MKNNIAAFNGASLRKARCHWLRAMTLSLAFPWTGYAQNEAIVPTACAAIKTADFSALEDAPTQIKEARFMQAKEGIPAHCDVQGYIAPNIGFAVLLPVDRWNGKLIEVGCGGLCGVIPANFGACNDALRRGYACTASDQGNRSSGDGKWAYNNPQAEIDYDPIGGEKRRKGYSADRAVTLITRLNVADGLAE